MLSNAPLNNCDTLPRITLFRARYQGMGQRSAEGEQPEGFPGSATSFDSFVREQRGALIGFLRRRVSSEEDAQDVAQESFIRLIRYREYAPESWGSLLYRIAINALNDRARRAHTHHTADHVSLDDNVFGLPSMDQAHDQQIETQQELARVQKALLGLPTRCREIYLLNRIEGMSYPEVAKHCGISVKAVEKQISKALVLLRKRLGEYGMEAI